MKALPEGFDASSLIPALADGWGFDAETIDYAAVGFGSYHWVAVDVDGRRAFVTVDDLDRKPWLGDTRDTAFDGLRRAFGSAIALRDAGLDFVLAPIPTGHGEPLCRIGARHSAAIFPFVDGRAGQYGTYDIPGSVRLLSSCSPSSIEQRQRPKPSRAGSISTCLDAGPLNQGSATSTSRGPAGPSPNPPGRPCQRTPPMWLNCSACSTGFLAK